MIIKKFTPINKHILVKLLGAESKTNSGIYLPDDAKTESKIGRVVAISNDKLPIKPGDLVMFSTFTPNKFEINGEEHLVLETDDLLGKIE